LRTFLTGLLFDLGSLSFLCIPAVLYYTLVPDRWIGSKADRIMIWFFTSLILFLLLFVFLAELTFWDEFRSRFNFIAVDYLIYTYEVIANIRESYPLSLLISIVVLFTAGSLGFFYYKKAFAQTFAGKFSLKYRIGLIALTAVLCSVFVLYLKNSQAEWSDNRYNSEISKAGIYSFFAAFRNNQMRYPEFYTSINDTNAFRIIKEKLNGSSTIAESNDLSIRRKILVETANQELKKNVVFILVESMSANFMKEFGNDKNITPFMDSLAQESIFFTDLYATGTRTVRGMEAVTLCIPPTPGQSIVKRPANGDLFSISTVFREHGYAPGFFYGGDGYFDNMNAFFGGNGFSIYDRGRSSLPSENVSSIRHHIKDREVSFENAWGICDEDIYSKMLSVADQQYANHQPFFNFVMTTSNHKPYTYPSGKIDIPSGTGRNGAVKYTDYALKEMFAKAKIKPWYTNTVFVIIADHCASSAGKNEIDVANYHIPAFIVNMPGGESRKISQLCSQIDLFPTLFSLFHWNYISNFFGNSVTAKNYEERALMGTYRKLALMKEDKVMILSDQKKQAFYHWNKENNLLQPMPMNQPFLKETIAWYQTADYLFTHKLLK
jgi:phosphoglycerol transferase MdoB-like AlkP superfamily enzyme